MKYLVTFTISFCISVHTIYAFQANTEDTMEVSRSTSTANFATKDSIHISVEYLDRITQSLQKNDNNWVSNILPSIAAIIVVVISSLVSHRIAKNSLIAQRDITAKQYDLTKDQMKSDEAISQEQLRLTNKQIEETSKMTLAQVRANNISQARIHWIQELRDLLCSLIGMLIPLAIQLHLMMSMSSSYGSTDGREAIMNLFHRIGEMQGYILKIILLLNGNEEDHRRLLELLAQYEGIIINDFSNTVNQYAKRDEIDVSEIIKGTTDAAKELREIAGEIIHVANQIIKQAWEQAKTEGETQHN